MNEEHIIAAILAAGLVAQSKSVDLKPKDAVAMYGQCLAELLEVNRPPRSSTRDSTGIGEKSGL